MPTHVRSDVRRRRAGLVALLLSGAAGPAATQTYPYDIVVSLHDFGGFTSPDEGPATGIVAGPDGALYGGTSQGGVQHHGRIFEIDPLGNYVVRYDFDARTGASGGPNAPLLLGTDGNLYGTTQTTLFRLTKHRRFEVLHEFTPFVAPQGALVEGPAGRLYGVTEVGGAQNMGMVYRLMPDGEFQVLHEFTGPPDDGRSPNEAPIVGPDGALYGTTYYGGATDTGAIYRIGPAGDYSILHSFVYPADGDGLFPASGLARARDGRMYGTTTGGGDSGFGTVYDVSPSGAFDILHSFEPQSPEGNRPYAGLTVGHDGYFYGATSSQGSGCCAFGGAIFRMTIGGRALPLVSFQGAVGWTVNGRVVVRGDGNLYYADNRGGRSQSGSVGRVSPAGVAGSSGPTPRVDSLSR